MRFRHNAAMLGAAAAVAAAVTATPVLADDHHDNHAMMGMHMDPMHDYAHHPAMRQERRPRMPHHGMH